MRPARRAAAIVVLSLLGNVVLLAQVSAATAPTPLIVSGSGSGSARMELTEPVSIPCCSYDFLGAGDEPWVDIQGFSFESEDEPTYVGFALQSVEDGSIVVGAVNLVHMHLQSMAALVQIKRADEPIPAGSYVVHLLSDVPVTLTIEADGLPAAVNVDVAQSDFVWTRTVELQPVIADAHVSVEARQTVEVRPTSLVIQATRLEGDDVSVHTRFEHCLRRDDELCAEVHHRDGGNTGFGVQTHSGIFGGTVYTTERFETAPTPGTHEALFTAQAVAARSRATGFVLVADLAVPAASVR